MNYSLGPRVDLRIRRVLATISRVDPRVVPKVGPSQVRVDPNVEESQLRIQGRIFYTRALPSAWPILTVFSFLGSYINHLAWPSVLSSSVAE